MCGIVGYVGSHPVVETLLNGLKRLEYRGYDSAGIAVVEPGDTTVRVVKNSGKVSNLQKTLAAEWPDFQQSKAKLGIAHTRWATHGPPTRVNAHPHTDPTGRFCIVHNGIIENYSHLKDLLTKRGRVFVSETDSEVVAHLVAECYEGDLVSAVAAAIKQLHGTYGLAVLCADHPDRMVVARKGSPIVIGIGSGETIVASDISAIISHTKQVIYLEDDDIAEVKSDDVSIRNVDNVPVTRETAHIDWDPGAAEKGGYEHFMLKEIHEQPESIGNSIRGRLNLDKATAALSGLDLTPMDIAEISRITIAACGTSLHAGMVGEYFFEDLADIPTELEQAAEFRYRNPIIRPKTLFIAISQSGETADTLAAVREATQKGAIIASICNVVGSTIARESARGIYLHAGPEIGVASTKAFTCQVAVLLMMALKFGRAHRLSQQRGVELIQELQQLPALVRKVLETAPEIERIAKKHAKARDFFYIGRGYLYPVALEGALKLKEISYIHAEGYHAAELKHGPIALLEPGVPVVALANDIPGMDKMMGNIQECRARGAPVIATATEGCSEIARHADDILWIPRSSQFTVPITTVVALQLLAYYVARERGCAIDQPRNLAKSVTVE